MGHSLRLKKPYEQQIIVRSIEELERHPVSSKHERDILDLQAAFSESPQQQNTTWVRQKLRVCVQLTDVISCDRGEEINIEREMPILSDEVLERACAAAGMIELDDTVWDSEAAGVGVVSKSV